MGLGDMLKKKDDGVSGEVNQELADQRVRTKDAYYGSETEEESWLNKIVQYLKESKEKDMQKMKKAGV
jgi:hypothetical protein